MKVCEKLITACICPLPNFSFLLHLGHVKTQPERLRVMLYVLCSSAPVSDRRMCCPAACVGRSCCRPRGAASVGSHVLRLAGLSPCASRLAPCALRDGVVKVFKAIVVVVVVVVVVGFVVVVAVVEVIKAMKLLLSLSLLVLVLLCGVLRCLRLVGCKVISGPWLVAVAGSLLLLVGWLLLLRGVVVALSGFVPSSSS